jgi:hypothetical protein
LNSGDVTYDVIVELIDRAGNIGYYHQIVRLDTAGPAITVTLSAPQGPLGYDGSANISISESARDLSGVQSLSYSLDGGAASTSGTINVYSLAAGSHTVVITAVDGVGNVRTSTQTFAVQPSLTGIQDAVTVGANSGTISNKEQRTLASILSNGQDSLATRLAKFQTEVSRQAGGAIATSEANLLLGWAQSLQMATGLTAHAIGASVDAATLAHKSSAKRVNHKRRRAKRLKKKHRKARTRRAAA